MSRTLEGLAEAGNFIETARAYREAGDHEAYRAICAERGVDELSMDRFWNGLCDDFDMEPSLAPEAPEEALPPASAESSSEASEAAAAGCSIEGNICKAAAAKIESELKSFKGGRKETAVSSHVAKTLKAFCGNEEFALAVAKSKKTLSACCTEIMKSVGSSISDIEVYRRAAKFYFPGASVKFNMEIQIGGAAMLAEAPAEAPAVETTRPAGGARAGRTGAKRAKSKADEKVIQISLFD